MKNIIEEIHKLQKKKKYHNVRDKIFLLEMEDLFRHLPFFENVIEIRYFPWVCEADESVSEEEALENSVWYDRPQMFDIFIGINNFTERLTVSKGSPPYSLITSKTGEFLKSSYLKSLKRKMRDFDFYKHFTEERKRILNDEEKKFDRYLEWNDSQYNN